MNFSKDDSEIDTTVNITESLTTNIKIDCLKDQVKALKFIVGGLVEYITEQLDFWEYHNEKHDIIDSAIRWATILENGLQAEYLPPKSACTCPRDWAEEQMKFVQELLHEYWKVKAGDDPLIQIDLGV